MPVTLAMKISGALNVDMKVLESSHKFINKLEWDKAKEQEFQCLTGSVEIQDLLQKATEEITLDTDMVLDSFVGCLKAASKCMVKEKAFVVTDLLFKKLNGLTKCVGNTKLL